MAGKKKQGFTLTLPRLPEVRLPGVPELQGAPRRQRLAIRPALPYPPPPPGFVNSLAEWVIMWWLSEGRASIGQPTFKRVGPTQEPVRGSTYFYQVSIPNLGHFQSEVTRVDFLIPGYGGAGYDSLVIDAYNTWTHPSPNLDLFKRETLATQARIRLIWILTDVLEAGNTEPIEAALRGEDESPRALFGI